MAMVTTAKAEARYDSKGYILPLGVTEASIEEAYREAQAEFSANMNDDDDAEAANDDGDDPTHEADTVDVEDESSDSKYVLSERSLKVLRAYYDNVCVKPGTPQLRKLANQLQRGLYKDANATEYKVTDWFRQHRSYCNRRHGHRTTRHNTRQAAVASSSSTPFVAAARDGSPLQE